jgi:gliding motility-associated-like protein
VVLPKDSCLKNVFVPNTFTPNGDGNNDKVYLRAINTKDVLFRIFNRWGEEVFRTESIYEGWDGSYKGVKQTPQVFVYFAEVTFWDDTKKIIEGNITLVR